MRGHIINMKKNLLIAIIVVLTLWLAILSIVIVENHNSTTKTSNITEYNVTGFSTDLTKVVEDVKSSVVTINQNETYSTGFIYSKKDDKVYIITSFHGVSESDNVAITFNSGVSVDGRVIGHDVFADIAVLECEFNYEVKPVTMGDATLLNDGEFIVSIGTATSLEYDFSSALGMVASSYREIENNITFEEEAYDYYLGIIQLNGDFVSGYSGAPVLNMEGEVVGMITMEEDNNTLAITVNEISRVVEKIINNEEYTRITFGINGKYIRSLENYEVASYNIGLEVTSGYYVTDIKVPSLANNIGILRGDVITSINGIELKDYDDTLDVIYSNDSEFEVTVIRNNETITLKGNLYD